MRIEATRTYSKQQEQNFGAKLTIEEPFMKILKEKNHSRDIWKKWQDKANRIGLESDLIEIRYGYWKSKADTYEAGQDNFFMDFGDNYIRNLSVVANINGKSFPNKYKVSQKSMADVEKESDRIIEETLEDLYQKYPNDIWG